MQVRRIERIQKFDRELKRLSRKHHGLTDKLETILDEIATDRIEGKRLSGYGEHKIFKIRCGTRSMGQRKGARIIYYKDDSVILLLGIFTKNQMSDIPHKEISERLWSYLTPNR